MSVEQKCICFFPEHQGNSEMYASDVGKSGNIDLSTEEPEGNSRIITHSLSWGREVEV